MILLEYWEVYFKEWPLKTTQKKEILFIYDHNKIYQLFSFYSRASIKIVLNSHSNRYFTFVD